MGVWFGCALPDDWGDAREEQRFANESVALIDKNYRAYFTFSGPDRVRYLNAILTNNIKDLAKGQGAVSLLLNAQGRILASPHGERAQAEKLLHFYLMIRERLAQVLTSTSS
jgi:folate-binding Fe-S cluster repair protein YgfZ